MFDKNLRYLREKYGMEQMDLAERLGRKSSSSVSEWEKGKYTPKIKTLAKIAHIFKVDLDDLMNKDLSQMEISILDKITETSSQLEETRQAKVYDFAEFQLEEQNKVKEETQVIYIHSKLSAGTGIVDLDPEYFEELEFKGEAPRHDLAFIVEGNSMHPTFEDGEIVFVERTPDIRSGQIIAVQINEEAFIKKVYRENNHLRLVSLNTDYEDIIADGNDNIRIVGRVIL